MINDFIVLQASADMEHYIWILQSVIAFVLILVFRDIVDFFPFTLLFGITDWFSYEFTAWWVSIFYRRGTKLIDYGIQESYYRPKENTIIFRSTDPDYKERMKEIEATASPIKEGTGVYFKDCMGKSADIPHGAITASDGRQMACCGIAKTFDGK